MTTLIGVLVLVALFALFPLIGRERQGRRCLACPIKRAIGGCNACTGADVANTSDSGDADGGVSPPNADIRSEKP